MLWRIIMKEMEFEIFELTSIETQIKKLEAELKELKGYEAEYKQTIMSQMEKENLPLIENESIRIKYVQPCTTKSVDESLLKEKYPEIYEEVLKESIRKQSLRITLK